MITPIKTPRNPVDTSDLKYQADKAYRPDKESTWKFPKEHNGWFIAHNTIRGEMQNIEDCLKAILSRAEKHIKNDSAKVLASWEIDALQTVFNAHDSFVHLHHENEDDIVSPWLATRINLPSKLTDDHEGIVKMMGSIEAKIMALKPGDERNASIIPLLDDWKLYATTMRAHLQEEEEISVVLLRAYFTPKEEGKMVEQLIKRETPLMMGAFVYHMGKDRCRKEFMPDHGIPFFVWWLSFSGGLKLYESQVVSFVEALKSGVEPAPPKRRSLLGC